MSDPIEEVLRVEGGRVVATLIRLTGDIGLAEDAVQEAVIVALQRWPAEGVPREPTAWLTTVARNKALDRIRRESGRRHRERVSVVVPDELAFSDSVLRDDQLRLLFTCCHPALSPEARVALALRTVAGLSTAEIAAALLLPEPTVGQRISRAKRKIAVAGIPYRIPDDHELPERLPAVLAVVYVAFSAGHHPAHGRADARVDMAEEGVRLAREVNRLMPAEAECEGLLALVLATHARRRARFDAEGLPVLMADQDRTRWDSSAIDEASEFVEQALARRQVGPFQIQAAIACLHGVAPTFADTDWPQIAELYRLLEHYQPTVVVRVNRSVAEAEVSGPEAGLRLLDTLTEADVDRWHLYWSVRSELLRRVGRHGSACEALQRALACEMNESDRRLLRVRARDLGC